MTDIYIARQPIYDRQLDVFAYELLFRDDQYNRAGIVDGDQATTDVIVNTFMEIGLNNIVEDRLAFINLTRSFFLDERLVTMPKDRVVLELLEDIDADNKLVQGVRRLAAQGYRIALDDFIYHESLKPLVESASIVKIDVMALSEPDITAHVRELRNYPLKLLAEKVETQAMFDFCMALGFDYFQGYFFAQPKVITGRALPNNRLAILKLLGKLQDPALPAEELEQLVTQDIALSFRILKYVNSAALALPRKIESIHQALVLVGIQNIRNWSLLLSTSLIDNKPIELVVTAMVRGRMAELLAYAWDLDNPDAYFTVGLFSALDALMDNTMEEILTQLPLAENIANALLHHSGRHGTVLDCVLAYERGEWEAVRCASLSINRIRDCYLDALQWANQMRRQLLEQ
jgi:EAL and modified HD-GYP domain-containing signal transduction protein